MAPPSVKQLLKDAKAALDEKDFSTTIQTCREVLKTDRKNYHAFVFIGVATAAQHDLERAVQSYQKAIDLRPNLTLAYRGLIDALSDDQEAAHRLILARAHVELARVSAQHATKSLPVAAELFYALADKDPDLTSEAVNALKEAQRCREEADEQNHQTAYRIARLLLRSHSIRISDDSEDLAKVLETSPISDAIDEYAKLLCNSPRLPREDDVLRFLVKRAALRIQQGEGLESNLDTIRKTASYETLLEVAELDQAQVNAPDRGLFSLRHMHMYPFEKKSNRSTYVFAAEFFRKTGDLDMASRISRVDTVAQTKKMERAVKSPLFSCTEAIVKAFFHLLRQEYKLASMIATEGKSLAETSGGRHRYEAFFDLVRAAALRGDRKYKESLSLYNRTKVYGQQTGHSWIENASHQGTVKTSVLRYGRRSRQTSTAVEEAAGSASNLFGLMECLWTDALAGDIDLARMEEISREAKERMLQEQEIPNSLEWECAMMDSSFLQSTKEMAAACRTRLGQSILEDTKGTREGLLAAQRHQMEAASTFKGMPGPFAQLGYIFEQLEQFLEHKDSAKGISRAIRCYEKAISYDSAHPVASRRLSQLLLRRGHTYAASLVAQNASEKDPTARWAHNVTGWILLSERRPIEAAVSFRNALRGRPKQSFKEEEVVFGTDVGRTEEDNLLLLDVDSWRGLCNAYTQMGKIGPAEACLEDALALARKPPNVYMTAKVANFCKLQKHLTSIIEAEKGLTFLSQGNVDKSGLALESLQSSILNVALSQYTIGNALVDLAVEQWMRGCYSRATNLRIDARQVMERSLQQLKESQPEQSTSCMVKRLGDICMETSTSDPIALSRLVGETVVSNTLDKAILAYGQALHLSPWQSNHRLQDLAAALSRKARVDHDRELAIRAVHIAATSKLDPALTTITLLEAGSMTSASPDDVIRLAASLAQRVSGFTLSRMATIELCAALSFFSGEGFFEPRPDAAVRVIRENPLDWRGWFVVGKVREFDARANGWSREATKSCEEAFAEADRLGCGPAAVAGLVRCEVSLLEEQSSVDGEVAPDVYELACRCASNAARIGLPEPPVCTKVITRNRAYAESGARDVLLRAPVEDTLNLQRTLHTFPFLKEAIKATRLLNPAS